MLAKAPNAHVEPSNSVCRRGRIVGGALRVRADKPVTPAFLFAVLLWEPVRQLVQELEGGELSKLEAVREAIRRVLREERLNLQIEQWTEDLKNRADVIDLLDWPDRPLPPAIRPTKTISLKTLDSYWRQLTRQRGLDEADKACLADPATRETLADYERNIHQSGHDS